MKKIAILFIILGFSLSVFADAVIEVTIAPVLDMQWSSDGHYLAVGQHEGGLGIYDVDLNLLAHIYPQDTISSVSWSPDNQYLAIEHLGQLEILSWDSNQSMLTSIRVISSENPISSVAWSPMDAVVATAEIIEIETTRDDLTSVKRGWATYYVATWNIQSGQMIMRTPQSFTTLVVPFRFNEINDIFYFKPIVWKPDSNEIILAITQDMGSYVDSQIVTLDYQTGAVEDVIALPFSPSTMALKPDSTILAVNFDTGTYSTGTVEIDVNDYQGFNYLDSGGFQVVMSWSPDGRFLVIDSQLIDVVSREIINRTRTTISNFTMITPFANAWHPYRPIIALGDLSGNLTIEDATEIEDFTASPVANAGESRIVYVGGDLTADVVLDASASVDYDGTITGYEWREGENVLSMDMIADVNLPIGIHDIQLTVTDDDNLTDSVTIQIEVVASENTP